VAAEVVMTPGPGVDRRVALATSIHATPGLYALLLGSGMSSAAGVKTGWEIACDLVRRIAKAEGVSDDEIGDHPDQWWSSQGRADLRYDTLLAALASTDAARQLLLRSYFDVPAGGADLPVSAGHQAIAQLVAARRVRVIVTTNFDPLIERALHGAGIAPQVIYNPNHVPAMMPLHLAPVTVIKLHGDYAHLPLRNTPEELDAYPRNWKRLLRDVFDQYGLIVIGWSATYDTALAEAVVTGPNRRFPMYWMAHNGNAGIDADRIIANRRAEVIAAADAGAFLADLNERLDRLDQAARRQHQPRLQANVRYRPEHGAAPDGWGVLPLLQIRVAARFGAAGGTTGYLQSRNRDRLEAALNAAPATKHLRDWNSWMSARADEPDEPAVEESPEQDELDRALGGAWEQFSGQYMVNTGTVAYYRLGSDAKAGLSALATIRQPGPVASDDRLFCFDAAVSLKVRVTLLNVAVLIRDALVLATNDVFAALGGTLPPDAQVNYVEAHLVAAALYGDLAAAAAGVTNRRNDLRKRVDLSTLGSPGPPPAEQRAIEQAGFAATIDGPLTTEAAAELTVAGIEMIAYDKGWPNPDSGIAQLRSGLGLPPPS
jgi:hypothetical protein